MLDTLEFTRRMMESGMPEQTATQLAHELRDILPESQAATKADLAELRSELKTDMGELRAELRGEMSALRTELKTDLANLRAELKTDIGALKGDLGRTRGSIIAWVAVFVVIGQVLPAVLQFIHGFWHS